MVQEASNSPAGHEHAERVQVEMQNTVSGRQVQILVERHDDGLGWYTSGSLILPLHQLPLLEQAMTAMRQVPVEPEFAEIIPFPTGDLAA